MSKVIKIAGSGAEPFVMERFTRDGAMRQGAAPGGVSTEREAYERGFAAGEKAGFELGRQKAEVLFKNLEGILDELSSIKEHVYKACEKELVELAFAISRKVIQREMELNPGAVVECVRSALRLVVASKEVIIKVNPKDLEVIQAHKGDLSRWSDGIKSVTVEGCDEVARGGCVIETSFGEVDATVEGILAEIEERLKNAG